MNTARIEAACTAIKSFLPADFFPKVAIVLGTGLGSIAQKLEGAVQVPYTDVPAYPVSTVDSHAGRFSFGHLQGLPVVLQEGRCHLYEGYSPEDVALGVRIMAKLGAATLIITNAAGGLDPHFKAGSPMLISDHINFTGQSPLTGVGEMPGKERFVDMTMPYDQALATLAEEAALELGVRLEKGVYLGLRGPQMETRAETRMFRLWGASAVGMSTVTEVIAARHMGMRVLGLSALSNMNLPDCMAPAPLEEVIRVSGQAAGQIEQIILAVLKKI